MSIPTQQLASIWTKAQTSPEVQTREVPKPAGDELLIAVTGAAINPVDWKIRDHGYFIQPPNVLGSDASGKVAAVGSDVKNFKAGDRVFFQGLIGNIDRSTFQQYVTIPASLVARTPSNVTDDEAAGISLASAAGWTSLYAEQGLGISPAPWEQGGDQAGNGKGVIVLGGSSSVGQYTIQLARLSGFHVVTSASSKHADFLKKLGAAVVLDRHAVTTEDYVKALEGRPLVGVSDSVSMEDSQQLAVKIIKQYHAITKDSAKVNVTTNLSPNEAAKKAGEEASPAIEIRAILGLGHTHPLRPMAEKFVVAVSDWLENGKYFPNKPMVIPGGLKGVPEALDTNKKGVSGVKVVVRPQETEA